MPANPYLAASMKQTYVIIDDNQDSILETKAAASGFRNLQFVASASNYDDGLDAILEYNPAIVFLEIDPQNKESRLSLSLINELYRYLKVVPKIIVTTATTDWALEAIKYEVFDYCTKPLLAGDLRKALLRFERSLENVPQSFSEPTFVSANGVEESYPATELKIETDLPVEDGDYEKNEEVIQAFVSTPDIVETEEHQAPETPTEKSAEEKPLIICVKSYGDYRFIEAKDICYLQADNNSTDIHLYNGEMITAFKTLKHFETVLSSPFVRIHNSYIVNIDYVSRIHTGNAVCYIKNTTTKLPFSKSYKENVDSIINSIINGNYLEI